MTTSSVPFSSHQIEPTPTALSSLSAAPPPSTSSALPSVSAVPTTNPRLDQGATSSCQNLTSPYTSRHHGIIYDIVCDVNYDLSDLLGIYVNSFEACIDACSSFRANTAHSNSSCGAITYTPDVDSAKYDGNCYLKDQQAKFVPLARLGSSSARVRQGNL